MAAVFLFIAIATGACAASNRSNGDAPGPEAADSQPRPSGLQVARRADRADDRPSRFERRAFRDSLQDQKEIWTAPGRFRINDLKWFAPLGTITGLSFAYDPQISRRFVGHGTHVNSFQTVSTTGVVGMVGLGAGAYLLGVRDGNDRLRETGVLSAEAVADAMAYGTVLKYSFARERPGLGSGQGKFFTTESSPSFPSDHSLIAWSAASVIAHEYPGWATKAAVYGLAAGVSIARVAGDKHYASDVLVGSTAGWMIGRYVFKDHHERELDELDYGTFDSAPGPDGSDSHQDATQEGMLPYRQGSTYVPLDSWVYPALRRLAALRLIDSQTAGIAPWTRLECLRQVEEAESKFNTEAEYQLDPGENSLEELIKALKVEFSQDAEGSYDRNYRSLTLESVYSRYMAVMGPPLRDGFNFGQTIVNDFGRPYGQGGNLVTGFSTRAVSGRLAFYVRGEYQHAAQAPAIPDAARTFVAGFDSIPLPPAVPFPAVDQFALNEAYVSGYFGPVDFTFGKQSLWWGPSVEVGPWLYSDNATPIYMFRFNNRAPLRLPFGQLRMEFFVGKLSGHVQPARPWIQGQKITLKVTSDLELGFSRTIEFAGAGHSPLTLGTFYHSFFSVGDTTGADLPGHDPGDRRGGFDFSYRLPGLRKYGATLYGDSFTDDDPSPLGGGAQARAAWTGGLYLAQLPELPKLDLRLEGSTSDAVTSSPGRFVYFNTVYRDGYTNNKNLVGNWVGRQGVGFSAWSSYWFSPQKRLQFGYRRMKQSSRFLPGGGTQDDLGVRSEFRIRPDVELSGFVQYERWLEPILSPQRKTDWTSAIQISIFPTKAIWRSRNAAHDRP